MKKEKAIHLQILKNRSNLTLHNLTLPYLVYIVQIGGIMPFNRGKTLYVVKLRLKLLQLSSGSPEQEILLEPFEFRELIPLISATSTNNYILILRS